MRRTDSRSGSAVSVVVDAPSVAMHRLPNFPKFFSLHPALLIFGFRSGNRRSGISTCRYIREDRLAQRRQCGRTSVVKHCSELLTSSQSDSCWNTPRPNREPRTACDHNVVRSRLFRPPLVRSSNSRCGFSTHDKAATARSVHPVKSTRRPTLRLSRPVSKTH